MPDDEKERLTALETRMDHLETSLDRAVARQDKHVHDLRAIDRDLEVRTRSNERLLWMGMGALAVLQVVLKFLPKLP